jgi:hypothetical protein
MVNQQKIVAKFTAGEGWRWSVCEQMGTMEVEVNSLEREDSSREGGLIPVL